MYQLTVRGMDTALENRLRTLAQEKGISLNKAALLLLREGAGLGPEHKGHIVGDSLDELIGSWSEADEQAFHETQAIFETIEEALWR